MATLRITDAGGAGYGLLNDFDVGALSGLFITVSTPTQFSGSIVASGGTQTLTVSGSGFTYAPLFPVVPISGTVTGLEFFLNGNLAASLSGISIGTLTLLGLAQGGTTAALETIFGGNDSMLGSGFGDTLLGFGGNDTLNGGAGGADSLGGNAGNDSLFGGIGNDTISGGDGNDTLNGGTGTDRMVGGVNNDTYLVDAAGDVVIELVGQGIDTVRTTLATLSLASSVENMVATSAIAHTFTGNSLANAITGLTGADTLLGGVGNDTLTGAGGNDRLDGGTGTDRMLGGLNDDTYVVDLAGDVVVEFLNQGIDTVRTTLATLALGLNVENLLASNAIAHVFTGNTLGNWIFGGGANDLISGLAGNDSLIGGLGNDTLVGGAGADTINGGVGGDHHRINAPIESTAAAPDLVLGFVYAAGPLGDRIDLRGIDADVFDAGDQAFSYIAGAAFGGLGAASAGELRVQAVAPGRFRASGDVNGDGTADVAVDVVSVLGPVSGWFLL
jgi:Ca2+-binding RTX toxin-like protein